MLCSIFKMGFAARRRHEEAVQADLNDMAELEKELPLIKGRKKP